MRWICIIMLFMFHFISCSGRRYASENYTSYWNDYYAEREKSKSSSVQNLTGKKICEPLRLCLRDCIEKYPSHSFSWRSYRGRRRDIADFYTYSPVLQCEIYCYQGISCGKESSESKKEERKSQWNEETSDPSADHPNP